jgi:peptidyl-prolyl cis-trans isomerase SurA
MASTIFRHRWARPCGSRRWLALALAAVWLARAALGAEVMDRIVAVVDDGVILESEFLQKFEDIKRKLRQNNVQAPPDSLLARQVLERLVVDSIQAQMAEKAGIRVDEETLRAAVQQIAQRNDMSVEAFRANLRKEGIEYADFVEQIRGEIVLGRLRASQINNQIKVSDREVENYLNAEGAGGRSGDAEYLLGHILIATPRAASPAEVQRAREKAATLLDKINKGLDFKQAALGSSDDELALKGGDLGWRKKSQIPSLFADAVEHMKKGDVEGPIRNSSGYHIIKLLDIKGENAADRPVTKTRVRHILVKTNEALSDAEARDKLLALRHRIENGEDFAALARGHSDDKGSAIKGGELGWVQPGLLTPPFEEAMAKLKANELSEPVQTQFGWHLIQVLERQEISDAGEMRKNRAREEIFKRKAEEETELWLRRLRDEAYVEIRLDE